MFVDWILPLDLQPTGPSFLFDEPDVHELQRHLDDIVIKGTWNISDKINVSNNSVSHWQIKACVEFVLHRAGITSSPPGLGYEVVGIKTNGLEYNGNGKYTIEVIVCVHKPSRAYARALKLKIGHVINSDTSMLLHGQIIGYVPHDRIDPLGGYNVMSPSFASLAL